MFKYLFCFLIYFSCSAQTTDSLTTPLNTNLKSPAGAMLRSAVIPGWGQFYNESYIKVPIMFGVFAGIGYVAGWYHNHYSDYKSRYLTSSNLLQQNPALNSDAIFMREHQFNRVARDFYRDNRDTYLFYLLLAYMLNIVDAYVDAQLFSFDVDGPLSAQLKPTLLDKSSPISWRKPETTFLSLTINF